MRIIAGKLGGRVFQAPHGHRTHPMADKIRGALFNVLGDIEGLTVLDAFAGSGGLSFEAISRGAKSAIAIDHDGPAHKTLMRNIQDLGLEQEVKATKANASGWSDNNPEAQFDIVILAPPYDNLQKNLLAKLVKHTKDDGILVLDWPGKEEIPEFDGLEQITDKNYGDAQLIFYHKR
jgi:16S rRNA (guanine966-N2)-methyltransferase